MSSFSATVLLLAYMRGHKNKVNIKDLTFTNFSHHSIVIGASYLCKRGIITRVGLGKYILNNSHSITLSK